MGAPATTTTKVKATVTAVIDPSASKGVGFSVDYETIPPQNGVKKNGKFHVLADGPVAFSFHLNDKTGQLKLPRSGSDAIWFEQGETCPTKSGDGNGEFEIAPTTNGNKVDVVDKNNTPGPFSYTLNCDGDEGRVPCDPIIINF